jgi:adenylate cyclase class 2
METPIETEIKIRFPGSAADAHRLIEQLGYTVRSPRTLEVDQLFDRADSSLRATDQVLRLRLHRNANGEQWVLTYKGPAERDRYKSREEIETSVAHGDNLALVLGRLGYIPSFRYEKYRTTFGTSDQVGIVTVDETPIGIFLELEGPKEWIDSTATHLGFSTSDYVITSYAGLWKQYIRDRSNAPRDMIFLDHAPVPDGKSP